MTYRDASHPTLAERFDSAYYLDQRRYVETCGFAATANLFVRRDLFERVGLFDARLRSGGDKDWCLRAAQCGVSVIYAPDACVWHPARATWGEVWRKAWRIEQGQRPSTNVSLSVGIGGLLRHCRSVAASRLFLAPDCVDAFHPLPAARLVRSATPRAGAMAAMS